MSTPSSLRPRLACRLVRWCSPSGYPVTGWRSRHVEGCDACRRFFDAWEELESALRRDAARLAPLPVGLEQDILQAIRTVQPGRPRLGPATFARMAWSASAAVAVAAVVFYHHHAEPAAATATSSEETLVALDAIDSLADRILNSAFPSAVTSVGENDLRRELDAVYADTQSALRFLALNFLPSDPKSAAPAKDTASPRIRAVIGG